MATEYIEQRNGGLYIAGTRVSLDSLVYAFLRGESPEGILDSFPALGLEQVFGALAYYVANREAVDRYLAEGRQEFETLRQQARQRNPALYAKLLGQTVAVPGIKPPVREFAPLDAGDPAEVDDFNEMIRKLRNQEPALPEAAHERSLSSTSLPSCSTRTTR